MCNMEISEEDGKYCVECAESVIRDHIDEQIRLGKTKLTIYVSHNPLAKEMANLLISALSRQITEIELRSRGRYMARAIDILEIIKRKINIVEFIKSHTDILRDRTGTRDINISAIIITIKKARNQP